MLPLSSEGQAFLTHFEEGQTFLTHKGRGLTFLDKKGGGDKRFGAYVKDLIHM